MLMDSHFAWSALGWIEVLADRSRLNPQRKPSLSNRDARGEPFQESQRLEHDVCGAISPAVLQTGDRSRINRSCSWASRLVEQGRGARCGGLGLAMLFVRAMHVVGFEADRLQTIPRAIAGFGTLIVSLTAAGVLVSQFAGA